jgi:glycerate kinase
LGDVITRDLGVDVREVPGAGAAGGLGGGAMAFLGGRLRPGLELVAEAAGLDAKLEGAGLVFTAEGQIDEQTIYGKTPVGVARRAQAKGAAVIALGGTLREGYQSVYDAGVDAVFPIAPGPVRLAESLNRAEELLANTAESVMRLWLRAATQRG